MALGWGAGSERPLMVFVINLWNISWSFSCPVVGETVKRNMLMIWLHFTRQFSYIFVDASGAFHFLPVGERVRIY